MFYTINYFKHSRQWSCNCTKSVLCASTIHEI